MCATTTPIPNIVSPATSEPSLATQKQSPELLKNIFNQNQKYTSKKHLSQVLFERPYILVGIKQKTLWIFISEGFGK